MTGIAVQLVNRTAANEVLETHSQDKNPFVACYKHHTPSVGEWTHHVCRAGTATYGKSCTIRIPKTADLISRCMVVASFKKSSDGIKAWYPIEQLIRASHVWLGGKRVETHESPWFRVYDELYRPADEREAYRVLTNFHDRDPPGLIKTMHMPLLHWFCRGDPATALPLVSLEHTDVDLSFDLAEHVAGVDMTHPLRLELVCEVMHLAGPERAVFADPTEREVLISVLQMLDAPLVPEARTHRIDLALNNPVSTLVWCLRDPAVHGVFTMGGMPLEDDEFLAPIAETRIVLNGVDRASARSGSWNRLVGPFASTRRAPSAGIHVWDFGVDPTKPSGSMNCSALTDARLVIATKYPVGGLSTLTVMARTWNWLVLKDGMAGVKYDV